MEKFTKTRTAIFETQLVQLNTSALKMETVCSSKMLVFAYQSTRRYNPEHQHRDLHRRENLKSQPNTNYCALCWKKIWMEGVVA
jgi:hypothetical protein